MLFTAKNLCHHRLGVLIFCLIIFGANIKNQEATPSNNDKNVNSEQSDYHPDYSNIYFTYSGCDRIFVSRSLNESYGLTNGTFTGPNLERYPSAPNNGSSASDTTTIPGPLGPYSRQCIYTFIAGENERVRVGFTKFSLRSEAPDCRLEYLDVYSEIPSNDVDLLETPFGGRYCDQIIPPNRISLYRILVMTFYTEKRSVIGADIFRGNFEFISAAPYVTGTAVPDEVCSFLIHSENRREGEFISPTYPGVYPKNLTCSYLFKGSPGQRVKLEFMDFDLYSGGPHCPLDYMKIYDGDSERSPLINFYCGQQRQLLVFSSGTTLFVRFRTAPRISDVTNRGFSGYYEFSEKFVKLEFITSNPNSAHILGSECDQQILSRKESNGTITAPNYPFLYHPNVQCKYYIYGLQDGQNLERINFQFEMLHIPSKDVNECTDASVRLYMHTFNVLDDFDYTFCGESIPPPVVSDGPILMILFNSGTTQGQGFKAHYWFETDFKIGGTQVSPGLCQFAYRSMDNGAKWGEFNSPRHPSNYPSDTRCVYDLYAQPDEQILLVFGHFRYSDSDVASAAIPGYNEVCTHDWLEIMAFGGVRSDARELLIGRYCGYTAPGPVLSERGNTHVRIVANTDSAEVSSGFHCSYYFIKNSNATYVCGRNITGEKSGVIKSPTIGPGESKYPANKQMWCNWLITVRPGHRVLLHFNFFEVEGEPIERGCSGAVIRIWTDPSNPHKPVELCGATLADGARQFVSTSNQLRMTFVLAKKAVGSEGFSAIWTEVMMPQEVTDNGAKQARPPINGTSQSLNGTIKAKCPYVMPLSNSSTASSSTTTTTTTTSTTSTTITAPRRLYQCEKNQFCITHSLVCDGVINCGFGDRSDEDNCLPTATGSWFASASSSVQQMGGSTIFICSFMALISIAIIAVALVFYRNSPSNKQKAITTTTDEEDDDIDNRFSACGDDGTNSTSVPHITSRKLDARAYHLSHNNNNNQLPQQPNRSIIYGSSVARNRISGTGTGTGTGSISDENSSPRTFVDRSEMTAVGSTPTGQIIMRTRPSSSAVKSRWSTLLSTSSEGANQALVSGCSLDEHPLHRHNAPPYPNRTHYQPPIGDHITPSSCLQQSPLTSRYKSNRANNPTGEIDQFILPRDLPLPPSPPIVGYGLAGRRAMSSLSNYYPQQAPQQHRRHQQDPQQRQHMTTSQEFESHFILRKDASTSTAIDQVGIDAQPSGSIAATSSLHHNRSNSGGTNRSTSASKRRTATVAQFHTLPHRTFISSTFSTSFDDPQSESNANVNAMLTTTTSSSRADNNDCRKHDCNLYNNRPRQDDCTNVVHVDHDDEDEDDVDEDVDDDADEVVAHEVDDVHEREERRVVVEEDHLLAQFEDTQQIGSRFDAIKASQGYPICNDIDVPPYCWNT